MARTAINTAFLVQRMDLYEPWTELGQSRNGVPATARQRFRLAGLNVRRALGSGVIACYNPRSNNGLANDKPCGGVLGNLDDGTRREEA